MGAWRGELPHRGENQRRVVAELLESERGRERAQGLWDSEYRGRGLIIGLGIRFGEGFLV